MGQPLSILFEDAFCLAMIKPAGQFTQGTWAPPGEETLEQQVRRHIRPDDPANAYVGIVHRLDRPVSGVLIWAKTRKAARRLSKQFEARQVVKEYWAILEDPGSNRIEVPPDSIHGGFEPAGHPHPHVEIWEDWLTPTTAPDGKIRAVEANIPHSRLARTRVEFCGQAGIQSGFAMLKMWPATGRTHQLRVQCASRGMPILGDEIYGSRREFATGIALHARALTIHHPIARTELVLEAPTPLSWQDFDIGVDENR